MRLRVRNCCSWPESAPGEVQRAPEQELPTAHTRPWPRGDMVLPVPQNNSFPLTHLSIPSAIWEGLLLEAFLAGILPPCPELRHFTQVPGALTTWNDRARPPRASEHGEHRSLLLASAGPSPAPGPVLCPRCDFVHAVVWVTTKPITQSEWPLLTQHTTARRTRGSPAGCNQTTGSRAGPVPGVCHV